MNSAAASALAVGGAVIGAGGLALTLDPGVARVLCGPAISAWTLDLWITAPLGIVAAVYAIGAVRLAWRSPRGSFAGAAAFVGGLADPRDGAGFAIASHRRAPIQRPYD